MSRARLGPETGNPQDFKSFEDFFDAYILQTEYQIERAAECIKEFENYWSYINPSPVLAGTFIDCLKNGRDIGQGGAKYNNTGCMGACLANAADSLLAIKKLVFDEKKCNFDELKKILKDDFKDNEPFRQYILNRIPKWGNNNAEADNMARRVVDFYTDKVNGIKNNRGGEFQASMFTLDYRFRFGKRTGALPDGRKSGVYLAPGINAMTGMDKNGVTGLINSVTKLDFSNIPNGSVTDINLHPTAIEGEDGLNAFVSLIKTYFNNGGFGIQFNIFDTEMLRDAQKHPEKYATMQIRVTGWNVYFVSLSEYEQNQFIEENKHRMCEGRVWL
jgi:formate C-acetyltransferase